MTCIQAFLGLRTIFRLPNNHIIRFAAFEPPRPRPPAGDGVLAAAGLYQRALGGSEGDGPQLGVPDELCKTARSNEGVGQRGEASDVTPGPVHDPGDGGISESTAATVDAHEPPPAFEARNQALQAVGRHKPLICPGVCIPAGHEAFGTDGHDAVYDTTGLCHGGRRPDRLRLTLGPCFHPFEFGVLLFAKNDHVARPEASELDGLDDKAVAWPKQGAHAVAGVDASAEALHWGCMARSTASQSI